MFRQSHSFYLTGLLLLAACSSSDRVISQSVTVQTGGNRAEVRTVYSAYLPSFSAGQKWVYTLRTDSGPQEVSYEVISVNSNEVIQKVSVISSSGQEVGNELISLNRFGVPIKTGKTSLSQSLSFGGGFAGPQTQVNQSVDINGGASNVEVHQSATSGGTTVSQDIAPLKYESAGQEEVTVAAGKYTADVFKARSAQTYPRTVYTLWLSKNIGEVKSTSQVETSATASGSLSLRELKSFSIGAGTPNLAVKSRSN